ncbi:formylglycine-generating enzyme family protein [Fimbriiglobus ruber]|uniref:Sulfatase-modifying factor enzyme-like domain-containing protein n=1 Tax=Fimbriiglobus ruber TaxID=1908690 RepID=A0A225D2C5_9BACT|nr:formylglycine-generating enzyme family protein [Fimbriiglobus ruber]OWK35093.1 hypothetical protein FRUB_09935 [Fimbriiglobus ruber]
MIKQITTLFLVGGFALVAGVVCVAQPVVPQTVPFQVVVPAKTDLPPKNFTEKLPGTKVQFEMVYVPGGEFSMGSPEGESGRSTDEGPRHRVRVKPFWLGRFEVTWDEYRSFTDDRTLYQTNELPALFVHKFKADAITKPSASYVDEFYSHGSADHPALSITHHAAMMYCHWLRWKTHKRYRLPTEAEWEYACRAGYEGLFGFDAAAEKLNDYAWYRGNSATKNHTHESNDRGAEGERTTHRVGTKKPNKFGLCDMHGNVAEWCVDLFDARFYEKAARDNPAAGPVNVPGDKKWGHVVRGGSWADGPDRLRSAARRVSDRSWQKHDPQNPRSIWWLTKMDVIGFRVCIPVEEYPSLLDLKPMVVAKPE